MARCQICGINSPLVSAKLGVCVDCIRSKPETALRVSSQVHARTRQVFNLPARPPQAPNGLECGQCINKCKMAEGEKGYCGLVENRAGRLKRHGGTSEKGVLHWYYDPLPTNCVAWWFCPGCTGAGYPKYAYKPGAETGYQNLAVFYGSCSTDCLFCQNWHYRSLAQEHEPTISAEQLASKADGRTSCMCFFGGDPSTQMPHALKTSRTALTEASGKKRLLRICWETNGSMLWNFAQQAAKLSLESGGNMKFDIKMYDENLSKALCGTSNRSALENFQRIGERYYDQRPNVPVLTASTLLVSGYVDVQEVESISRLIADVNTKIPYTLLAFYSAYVLTDLPTTSSRQAHDCYDVAKKYLENVRIGNVHLLS